MPSRVLVPLNQGLLAFQPTRQRYWHPLSVLDNSMRDFGQQFRQMERQMDSIFRDIGFDPSSFQTGVEPEIVKEGDAYKYRLNVYVGETFSPENIKVSLKDRFLTVEAKKEQKSDDGNSRVYEEISRQFKLHDKIDLKDVKSILTPDGILKIEAPLQLDALPEPPKAKEIPIIMEN